MKAVHVENKDGQGALQFTFIDAQDMAAAALKMLEQAKLGNCNICFNSPGVSQEQAKLNNEMASFEALTIPHYEVSRIRAPEASSRLLVAVPERLGAFHQSAVVSASGDGSRDGKGRPALSIYPTRVAAAQGKTKASVGVTQPWEKQGITEEEWCNGPGSDNAH